MAKISRAYQPIFGSTAPGSGVGSIAQFGSLAAGSPTVSTSLATIMALGNWAGGWFSAVIGNNGPEMEDMNAVHYVCTTQLAYILQQGIAEWDATTPYYKGSLVNSAGVVWQSITDNNVDNAITDPTNWQLFDLYTAKVTTSTVMAAPVQYYRVDASGGAVTMTLPALASSAGVKFKVKKIDSSANVVTIQGNASENIDFANTYPLALPGDSVDLLGTADPVWDII